jgi:hypothetical protein
VGALDMDGAALTVGDGDETGCPDLNVFNCFKFVVDDILPTVADEEVSLVDVIFHEALVVTDVVAFTTCIE